MSDEMLELLRPIVQALVPIIRKACHWLSGMLARIEWQRSQQAARFLSRHPDLTAFDRWMDQWYTDAALA